MGASLPKMGLVECDGGGRGRAVEGDRGLPVELDGHPLGLGVADRDGAGVVVAREGVGERDVLGADVAPDAVLRQQRQERLVRGVVAGRLVVRLFYTKAEGKITKLSPHSGSTW